jgi:hypothetical protein
MTDRLKIYNGALMILGERELASLSEERESRHKLDQVWNDNGVKRMLEMAQWKFAMRASRVDFDVGVGPEWGFAHGFLKGDDWVVTSAVCQDEFFRAPLLQYEDEIGYWWADLETIYVRYVSDGVQYGGDLSKWPSTFVDAVKHYFALRIVASVSGADQNKIEAVVNASERVLRIAKNKDAMAGPARFAAQGSWSRARHGGFGSRGPFGDGGGRSSLIG